MGKFKKERRSNQRRHDRIHYDMIDRNYVIPKQAGKLDKGYMTSPVVKRTPFLLTQPDEPSSSEKRQSNILT